MIEEKYKKLLYNNLIDECLMIFLLPILTVMIVYYVLSYQGIEILFIKSLAITSLFSGLFSIFCYYYDRRILNKKIKEIEEIK